MWESWKTLFLKVLDKHAPKRSKTIRKKGNVPWFNKTVKNKLFQRDCFKRVATKTNIEMIGSCTGHLEMPQTLPCEMLERNTMQQHSTIAKLIQNMHGKQLMIYWEEARSKILLMKLTYQGKQLHQLENWLMFLTIILPMLVQHLLKKSNMNTPVAFGISFLNMNQMRNSFSSL